MKYVKYTTGQEDCRRAVSLLGPSHLNRTLVGRCMLAQFIHFLPALEEFDKGAQPPGGS
jgi:hypothetical protein